jgi:hypothetical protein
MTTLSRRKKIVFALTAIAMSVAAAMLLLLIADLIVHQRAERSAGLNRWGYRGPVAASKRDGELRAVMLGGSTVFGYGLSWQESIPSQLERVLDGTRPFSVINLGFNNEGAYSFLPTLRDFKYLDYDIVVLYEGYNDFPGDEKPNTTVFRHDSAIFRLTGYFPILPLYLEEKAMTVRYGGDLAAAYAVKRGEQPKTVFTPGIVDRTSATALDTVAKMTNSLGAQLGRLSKAEAPAFARVSRIGCSFPWVNYCESVHAAVRYAAADGKRVIVVGQPRMKDAELREAHERQQRMLGDMIRREFESQPAIQYVDLGGVIDLSDPAFTFDAMHLTVDGNRKIAEALAPHVLVMAAR